MTTHSIISAAKAAGYDAFASLVEASGYDEVLDGGRFTLFAPTNAAFDSFAHAALAKLLKGDGERLRRVTGYHFVAGKVLASRLQGKRYRAVMYCGADLIIDGKSGLRINNANITEPDIIAGGSVIHGIDGVLWPRQASAKTL